MLYGVCYLMGKFPSSIMFIYSAEGSTVSTLARKKKKNRILSQSAKFLLTFGTVRLEVRSKRKFHEGNSRLGLEFSIGASRRVEHGGIGQPEWNWSLSGMSGSFASLSFEANWSQPLK